MTSAVRAKRPNTNHTQRRTSRQEAKFHALVTDNLRLVYATVRRYWRPSHPVPYEDIVQTGMVALTNAARHFDPSRGLAFSTYAVTAIRNDLFKELFPRRKEATLVQVEWDQSLEPAARCEGERREEGEAFGVFCLRLCRVKKALKRLDRRQRLVLKETFGLDGRRQTQDDMTRRLGVSKSTVSNLKNRGLRELKARMGVGQ